MIRKVIGILIFVAVFVLLFLGTVFSVGLKEAAIAWGTAIGLAALMLIAVAMIIS